MVNNKMIGIINGPNINLLGTREPDVYGLCLWNSIEEQLKRQAEKMQVKLMFFQSNHEGDIVDFIHENMYKMDGVVINPAAFTKGGYSIMEALTATGIPFVEVHITNIFARGGWHAETIFAPKAIGHINGFGNDVYFLGLTAIFNFLQKERVILR